MSQDWELVSSDEHETGQQGLQEDEVLQSENDVRGGLNRTKPSKTSDREHASIISRQMEDAETALEVDHMILDYLLYQAIDACLAGSRHAVSEAKYRRQIDLCLFQVDQFLRLFRSRYPNYRSDAELRFRQLVLQLVTLTSQRFVRCPSTPARASLQNLRDRNRERARHWIGNASRIPTAEYNVRPLDDALPIPANEVEENRAHVLKSLGVEPEDDAYADAFYGTSESVALLDLLPLFMRVSAACHQMFECPPTEKWMRLAADLMLQACLEQYLVYGSSGSDAIDEAFAWGPKQQTEEQDEDDHILEKEHKPEEATDDDPFGEDMEQEDIELWQSVKAQALQIILSTEKQYWKDVASHLAAVWDKHPLSTTERELVAFLDNLAGCIAEPVLVQLQRGQLQGMSRAETSKFIAACGIDVASILKGRDAGVEWTASYLLQ
ncbi:hypothetical protein Slin15195_G122090 [Septoria linicola]|uniref:Uncharacterized protein n=1 Tax=Septoria linicola TaxID=215465 RepID=A0A9Q9EQ95_9PEZI|nr:hypothetical protein Slin14017_G078300 [Septoria linicola]USW58890.1 hypothetical protein Slin15195_G122090 [Septoria linicola]